MKRFAAFFLLMILFNLAQAQVIFACQNIKASGFDWKNGRWVEANFNVNKPFFIKYKGQSIDEESVHRLFSGEIKYNPDSISCTNNSLEYSSCMTKFGESLVFNPKIGQGAKSLLLGSTMPSIKNSKDSVAIELFTCQRM